jgi:4-alpha-glucanotransferase
MKPDTRRETRALRRLARFCGVHTAYTDSLGRVQVAEPEVLVAVLRALGQPVMKVADAEEALSARTRELSSRFAEPVAVAWDGEPSFHVLRVPNAMVSRPVEVSIELEDGGEAREIAETRPLGPTRGGDRTRVALPLPSGLPHGFHRMRLTVDGESAEVGLISAPRRCYEPAEATRGVGLFLPLYALVTERSWGTADLSDLARLAEWCGSHGCRYVGTLPLLASYLDEPFEPSPYVPVSRLFWTELYADVTAAPELELSPAAGEMLASAEVADELEALRELPLVDYRQSMALKRRVLEQLAATAFANHARRAEIEAYVAAEPGVDDYARFRAAVELAGKDWHAWDRPARDGVLREAAYDEGARRYHVYVQWLLRSQLDQLGERMRASGSDLYLDLPIGVHGGGYDVWRYRPHFIYGAAAGAPPDDFFTEGQNWGFPPIDPITSRERGHRYFRSVIRNHLRHSDVLRVDHVMGLSRLFWVPDGFEPAQGVYVSYPAEELYALLCVESHRSRTRLVGENLGTVPEAVNLAMEERGLLRMSVTQFELRADPENAVPEVAPGTLAGMNTHDLPPFASFWKGRDIDVRRSMGLIDDAKVTVLLRQREALRDAVTHDLEAEGAIGPDAEPDEVLAAILLRLAKGEADILLVNLEDLWLEARAQNVPGTVDEFPNWRRKAIRSLEAIEADEEIGELLKGLASAMG